jgi:oxaloacetate decarboxylase alpha subunit
MKTVNFVDTTLRDAHQSLWNGQMTTPMMLAIAPVMDRAGFEFVDLLPLVYMDWLVRYLHENPWDRMRLMAEALPNTPCIVGGVLIGFGTIPDSATELWMKRVADVGMRIIRINEPYHDMGRITKCIRWSQVAGLTNMVALIFTDSPVHTDEYYATKAEQIAKAGADIIFIKDVDGLLTPERTRTLVPAILKKINGIPLQLHAHCTTGLAPICYLEAIKLGVVSVHTANPPLANGSSQPSTLNVLRNARRLGFSSNLDEKAIEQIREHFEYIAKRHGFPTGVPVEYDVAQYRHQLPGGMISNYRFELSRRGLEHRLGDLLEEIALIRRELGYPIMVTPLSQYVGVQAILNITSGQRYKVVTDEIIKYVLGRYGELAAPVEERVRDRIMSLPRTRELMDWEPPQPSLEELRAQYGPDVSDQELLLRVMSTNQRAVDEILAAGPMKTDYPRGDRPEMALIQELTRRADQDYEYIHIKKRDFSLTLKGGAR